MCDGALVVCFSTAHEKTIPDIRSRCWIRESISREVAYSPDKLFPKTKTKNRSWVHCRDCADRKRECFCKGWELGESVLFSSVLPRISLCRKQPPARILQLSLSFAVLVHPIPCDPAVSSLQRRFGLPADLMPLFFVLTTETVWSASWNSCIRGYQRAAVGGEHSWMIL